MPVVDDGLAAHLPADVMLVDVGLIATLNYSSGKKSRTLTFLLLAEKAAADPGGSVAY